MPLYYNTLYRAVVAVVVVVVVAAVLSLSLLLSSVVAVVAFGGTERAEGTACRAAAGEDKYNVT